ncbi:ZIP Zinc transporter [Planctomycetes bacterium Pla163]|uniref:ZIP Zinc transporter n=1 Tax=Rohdeia mirabilis TaxID=2528008 RepID=A0A518D551_9BACT|nr:ZIP Zinc transporter [Planctomycetes bacterium Pla163]
MNDWQTIVALTAMAGLAMPAGALLARIERIPSRWLEEEVQHTIVAFGGGALLSAVALVLVPDGMDALWIGWGAPCFAAGGVAFMALDRWLARSKSAASNLAAMLSDFVPEAIALGAAFAVGRTTGFLLALLMALQNVPEGFNAYRELRASSGISGGRLIAGFTAMALLGPLAGLAGYFWLGDAPEAVGGIMLFAAGGILYAVVEDIAPQAHLERRWAPPLGAIAGFLLGMIGDSFVRG